MYIYIIYIIIYYYSNILLYSNQLERISIIDTVEFKVLRNNLRS